MGIEPAGVNGTFFQPIRFRRVDIVPEEILAIRDADAAGASWPTDLWQEYWAVLFTITC